LKLTANVLRVLVILLNLIFVHRPI